MMGVYTDLREVAAQIYRPTFATDAPTVVVSFPKSGVTWLRYLTAQVIAHESGIAEVDQGAAATVQLDGLTARLGLPRILWSHNGSSLVFENGIRTPPAAMFLTPVRLGFQFRRVLLLVRDPRDVTVSNYHQVTRRTARPLDVGSIDDFYLDPQMGLRRAVMFLRQWRRSVRLTRAFHLLRYEELRSGDAEQMARAMEFVLHRPVRAATCEAILDDAKPDAMRERERRGTISGMRQFDGADNSMKVRRGVVGGFRDELRPETVAAGDKVLRDLDWPFGYGR